MLEGGWRTALGSATTGSFIRLLVSRWTVLWCAASAKVHATKVVGHTTKVVGGSGNRCRVVAGGQAQAAERTGFNVAVARCSSEPDAEPVSNPARWHVPQAGPNRGRRFRFKPSLAMLRGRLLRPPHTCYCGFVLGSGLRPAALQTSPVVPPSDGKVLATGPRRAAPFSGPAASEPTPHLYQRARRPVP